MPSTRSLCMGGGLITAVNMLRRSFSHDRILERLAERFPDYLHNQYLECFFLAQRGVAFMDSIDWEDPDQIVDVSQAPQLPKD